jgi:Mrp family chromosome partitioning ATPase
VDDLLEQKLAEAMERIEQASKTADSLGPSSSEPDTSVSQLSSVAPETASSEEQWSPSSEAPSSALEPEPLFDSEPGIFGGGQDTATEEHAVDPVFPNAEPPIPSDDATESDLLAKLTASFETATPEPDGPTPDVHAAEQTSPTLDEIVTPAATELQPLATRYPGDEPSAAESSFGATDAASAADTEPYIDIDADAQVEPYTDSEPYADSEPYTDNEPEARSEPGVETAGVDPAFGVNRQPVDVSEVADLDVESRVAQYRRLGESLRAECARSGLKSVLLLGVADESELAQTTASLAAVMTQPGRVLLVDGDLRDQRLTKALRQTATPGLASAFDEDCLVGVPAVPTTTPGLDFMPSGQLRRSIRREDSQLLANFLREIVPPYDTVLIDGGSLPAMVAELLAEVCDATCPVVQLGRTEANDANGVIRQVRDLGGHVLGCIATNAPPSADTTV